MVVELPDDVMDILQTRNKHLKTVANVENKEKGEELGGVSSKTKGVATDEMLLNELESALKNI